MNHIDSSKCHFPEIGKAFVVVHPLFVKRASPSKIHFRIADLTLHVPHCTHLHSIACISLDLKAGDFNTNILVRFLTFL
jgi:hypothetical protein